MSQNHLHNVSKQMYLSCVDYFTNWCSEWDQGSWYFVIAFSYIKKMDACEFLSI